MCTYTAAYLDPVINCPQEAVQELAAFLTTWCWSPVRQMWATGWQLLSPWKSADQEPRPRTSQQAPAWVLTHSLPSPATHAFWAKHRAVQRPGCWMRLAGVVKEDGFVNNRPGFRCCPFPDLVKMFASSIAVSVLGPQEVEDFFSCQMTQF